MLLPGYSRKHAAGITENIFLITSRFKMLLSIVKTKKLNHFNMSVFQLNNPETKANEFLQFTVPEAKFFVLLHGK